MSKDTDMTMQEQVRAWPLPLGSDDDEFRNIVADHIDQLVAARDNIAAAHNKLEAEADQLEADKAELVDALKTAFVFGSNMSVEQTRNAEQVLMKMTGDRAWLATPDFGHKRES